VSPGVTIKKYQEKERKKYVSPGVTIKKYRKKNDRKKRKKRIFFTIIS